MRCNSMQRLLGASMVADKEIIFAELIVDAVRLAEVCEVDPCLGDAIAKKASERRAIKALHVIADRVPILCGRQRCEEPRSVAATNVEKTSH